MSEAPSTDEHEPSGGVGVLGTAMGLLALAWAAVIASFPLNDNSFFTHLATGRLILDQGSIPSTDPYTFTARGADWTVQSWLASAVLAAVERLGGELGLRVLVLAVFLVAALLLWRLSRPAESLLVRWSIVSVALFVATGLWAERPYMVGVVGIAVLWLALEGAVRPWLLVPMLWVWANSHASYPLGILLVLTVLAGEALDRRRHEAPGGGTDLRAGPATELAVLRATVAGTFLAMIGPLGVDVILFPIKTVTQSGLLAEIVEWQPPEFRSVSERAFLALTLATLVALARDGRWRFILPAVLFVGAAVVAQRNVVMATMVLVPILAACAPVVGTLTSRTRPGLGVAFTAFCGLALALAVTIVATEPTWELGDYPTRSVSWLGSSTSESDSGRVATQDVTGNLLHLLDGPTGEVFIDDRADMFPADVFEDYVALLRGSADWATILEVHDIDIVVWERSRPLASLLASDRRWRMVFAESGWAVACRRGSGVCDSLAG